MYKLTLWTNDPERAAWADCAGIDRIGLDLETIGKQARQAGHGTWLSPHSFDDFAHIKQHIKNATLFARTNPIHPGSRIEIDQLVEQGITVLMLPNFTTIDEVVEYKAIVAGRAKVVPLVERLKAVYLIEALSRIGIEEIHVGLNDLSIDLGLKNRLSVLNSAVLDKIATDAHSVGMGLGVGGLGRPYDESLPVPSDLVYAQHARLGASGALIARSFFARRMSKATFVCQIQELRARLKKWFKATPGDLEAARMEMERRISMLAANEID